MTRPSPLVLLVLLLGTTWLVAPQPLVRVMALLGILAIICAIVAIVLIRRGWRTPLLAFVGIVGLAAFVGVGATRPQLRQTYLPDQLTHASEVADSRGFYPSETDGAGNRFAWTQDRATLVLDFLVRKPITLTVEMRSAAVASGPDEPVDVVVNGVEVGQLHPDPKNGSFQSLSLRFTPFDWGGEQTEIKLLPAAFRPGKGDARTLGMMIKSITVDKTEAWLSVSRRVWLFWILPFIALFAASLIWAARRYPARQLTYGAVALCILGFGSAATFFFLIQRVNVIDSTVYRVWSLSTLYLCVGFVLAAINIPVGSLEAPTIWQRLRRGLRDSAIARRIRPHFRLGAPDRSPFRTGRSSRPSQ
jgi:hypothetical protein